MRLPAAASDKGLLVGLILPQIQNELFGMTAEIVAHRCSKNGFQMMLAASEDDPVAEYNQVLVLRQACARGIILTPTPGLLEKTAALLQGVPLVQYARHHPRLAAPSVSVDGERDCWWRRNTCYSSATAASPTSACRRTAAPEQSALRAI